MRRAIQIAAILFLATNALFAQVNSSNIQLTEREWKIIAAAKLSDVPEFHGSKIIGIHPNAPLVYSLTASGENPISYSTVNLPAGLSLDPETGIITGALTQAGSYLFKVGAKNSFGKARSEIKIVCGEDLALTPPLG